MRYSYKDIFELRDTANTLLSERVNTHVIVCKAKFEFVDLYWKNVSNSTETLLIQNVSRDECYRWFCGFITSFEINQSRVIDGKKSWWSKNVMTIFNFSNIK